MTFTEFLHERPLHGYGLTPPDPKWPHNAKLAVTFVIDYHEGAEKSVESGDTTSEMLHNELLAPIARPARDDMAESEWEYGPRAGLPRLLNLFGKYGMKGTINISAIDKSPYWASKLQETGWELSCASKRWIDYLDVSPEQEDKDIREAITTMQKISKGPMGFCVGRRSNYSQRLYAQACKDMNVDLLYSSDSMADEIPVCVLYELRNKFWLTSPIEPDEGMLIVPSTLDTSDIRFNVNGQGWGTGADYLQYLSDTFKYYYEEGQEGHPRTMVVPMNSRIVGHGSRAYYLEQFLKLIAGHDDVWVASRAEIANHWRSAHPYDASKAHDKVDIVKNVNPYKA